MSGAPALDRHWASSRVPTHEQAELSVARKRIAELEAELAIHRRAAELLGEATSPKGGSKPSA